MTNPYKDPNWTPGQCALDIDLMAGPRIVRAQLLDMGLMMAGGFAGGQGGVDYSAGVLDRRAHLWAMGDSGGCYPSPIARLIRVQPGPIFQWVGLAASFQPGNALFGTVAPNLGSDPYVLAYWAELDELNYTHEVGDAANPRWDLAVVKLSTIVGEPASRQVKDTVTGAISAQVLNLRRNVAVDRQIVKGTPAASPTIPAVPAGYVALYAVFVPTNHNAAFDARDLLDFRMPLGSFSVDMHAVDFNKAEHNINPGTITYTKAGGQIQVSSNDVGFNWYAFPKYNAAPHSARLIGVQVMGSGPHGAADFVIGRMASVFASTFGNASGISNDLDNTPLRAINTAGFLTEFRGVAVPTTVAKNSCPLWINGRASPLGNRPEFKAVGTDDIWERICLYWLPANITAHCTLVRMHFAGGF